MPEAPRKGSSSRASIPPATLSALNEGRLASATLVEGLAVDFAVLLRAAAPGLPADGIAAMQAAAGQGVTRRMALAAALLLDHCGLEGAAPLAAHPSDTVRGWAAFMFCRAPGLAMPDRVAALRGLADDPHFGVREWAWLALRPHVVAQPFEAIALLRSWAGEASANLRRFAVEATRPRGVWAAHVGALRRDPTPGVALLEPLRSDPSTYVQDSVANWINDAARDHPDWARSLCARWMRESPMAATRRICARGLRSL
jgi:3-methyladenine DNA glycosylase AlkC